MKYFNLEMISMILLVVAGLNAGIGAVFNYEILGQFMTGYVATGFYGLVGLAALYAAADHFGLIGAED